MPSRARYVCLRGPVRYSRPELNEVVERSACTLVAALAAVPFFSPLPRVPQDALAHGMPSVSEATYRVVDTVTISIQSPMGPMDMNTSADISLAVGFEGDPAGFRATARIADFRASVANPMMGTQSIGGEAAQGAVVVLVGPAGMAELVGLPEVSPEASELFVFEALGHDLFPGLPARAAAAGDSWTDTVTWSTNTQGLETNATGVRTFALGDETVIDGRSLWAISVSATVESSGSGSEGGVTITRETTGTFAGTYYWDAEAGLLHSAELTRDLQGTVTVPGAPAMQVGQKGTRRIWRES